MSNKNRNLILFLSAFLLFFTMSPKTHAWSTYNIQALDGWCHRNTQLVVSPIICLNNSWDDTRGELSITVNAGGNGSGVVNPQFSNVSSAPSTTKYLFIYDYLAQIYLIPQANYGSRFIGWSGDCRYDGYVRVTKPRTCTATFALNTYTLSITKAGSGNGTVTSNPAGITCGSTCASNINYNTSVILTAVPSAYSTFVGWSGEGCSGTATCTVIVNGAKNVTAIFNLIPSPSVPTISGPISGFPNVSYKHTFNATDPSGYQIRYGIDWTIDGVADEWLPLGVSYVNSGVSQSANHSWSSTGTKTFKALTQNYQGVNSAWSNPYSISIVNPPITGVCGSANRTYSSGSSPYGADTYCSSGTPSTSPPPPTEGASVTWTCLGSNGGSNSPLCMATLVQSTYLLTTVRTMGGVIKSTDNIIVCGNNCTSNYNSGGTVTLTAIPSSSYWRFVGWLGDCSGTSPICVLNIDGDKNVTAIFSLRKFNYQEF